MAITDIVYWPRFGYVTPDSFYFTDGDPFMIYPPDLVPWPLHEITNRANYALWQMGTNAHPFLLRWMKGAEPMGMENRRDQANKLLWHVTGKMPLKKSAGARRAATSAKAFCALGTRGAAAIGPLTLMLNDPDSSAPALLAAEALGYLRQSGRAALFSAITNQNNHPQVRIALIGQYSCSMTAPMWRQALKDPNRGVRIAVTNNLRQVEAYMPGSSSDL